MSGQESKHALQSSTIVGAIVAILSTVVTYLASNPEILIAVGIPPEWASMIQNIALAMGVSAGSVAMRGRTKASQPVHWRKPKGNNDGPPGPPAFAGIVFLALLLPGPANGAEIVTRTAADAVTAATTTVEITLPAFTGDELWDQVQIWIVASDDGDGGDFSYTVKQCPSEQSVAPCQDFATAVSGTLTVGGDEVDTVTVVGPFRRLSVEITGNDCQVTVHWEALRK